MSALPRSPRPGDALGASLSSTGAAGASAFGGGGKPITVRIDDVQSEVGALTDAVHRLDAKIATAETVAFEQVRAAQAALHAQLAALRDSVDRRFTDLARDVAALQKSHAVARGEAAIMAAQGKDNARAVAQVATVVAELVAEVRGAPPAV